MMKILILKFLNKFWKISIKEKLLLVKLLKFYRKIQNGMGNKLNFFLIGRKTNKKFIEIFVYIKIDS